MYNLGIYIYNNKMKEKNTTMSEQVQNKISKYQNHRKSQSGYP